MWLPSRPLVEKTSLMNNKVSYDLMYNLPLSLNSFHKEQNCSKNKLNCLLGKPGKKQNVLILKKQNPMN